MRENLLRFIEHARQKGMDHATIFLLLRSSGWKEKEIAEAFAARELTIPIPERAGVGSARDAFFHLLAFTALYAWAISLIFLFFTYTAIAFFMNAARPGLSCRSHLGPPWSRRKYAPPQHGTRIPNTSTQLSGNS